jgi:hypothetical protein
MTEKDIIRMIRRDPQLQVRCRGLGEFTMLVATARMTWRICNGNMREMERSFSPHVIDLAALDGADIIVDMVRASGIYPPVAGT